MNKLCLNWWLDYIVSLRKPILLVIQWSLVVKEGVAGLWARQSYDVWGTADFHDVCSSAFATILCWVWVFQMQGVECSSCCLISRTGMVPRWSYSTSWPGSFLCTLYVGCSSCGCKMTFAASSIILRSKDGEKRHVITYIQWIKNLIPRPGDVVRLVKYSACKHEDPSSAPWNPCEKLGILVHLCCLSVGGRWVKDRRKPGSFWAESN